MHSRDTRVTLSPPLAVDGVFNSNFSIDPEIYMSVQNAGTVFHRSMAKGHSKQWELL